MLHTLFAQFHAIAALFFCPVERLVRPVDEALDPAIGLLAPPVTGHSEARRNAQLFACPQRDDLLLDRLPQWAFQLRVRTMLSKIALALPCNSASIAFWLLKKTPRKSPETTTMIRSMSSIMNALQTFSFMRGMAGPSRCVKCSPLRRFY